MITIEILPLNNECLFCKKRATTQMESGRGWLNTVYYACREHATQITGGSWPECPGEHFRARRETEAKPIVAPVGSGVDLAKIQGIERALQAEGLTMNNVPCPQGALSTKKGSLIKVGQIDQLGRILGDMWVRESAIDRIAVKSESGEVFLSDKTLFRTSKEEALALTKLI